jgi:hypothetical protein
MDKKLISTVLMFLLLILSFSGCTDSNIEEITQFSITSFKVEPSIITEGETANLSWFVFSAQTVSIDNGIGTVSNTGSRIIQPTENTTYTLTTHNKTKTLNASTQIIVNQKSGEEDSENDTEINPTLQFEKDDVRDRLTLASVDPEGMKWSEFSIVGECNTSSLGTYVVVGDTIRDCSGIIIISYISTNTLVDTWTFSEVIPELQIVKDDIDNKLIVASVSPSNLKWSDFSIFTDCSTVQLYEESEWITVETGQLSDDFGYVEVGDYFRNLKGDCSISIRHIDSNTQIGIWDFT